MNDGHVVLCKVLMLYVGLVIEVRSLPDHEPSQARVELAQVRERIKEMAQSSDFASAGQIFHASSVFDRMKLWPSFRGKV